MDRNRKEVFEGNVVTSVVGLTVVHHRDCEENNRTHSL